MTTQSESVWALGELETAKEMWMTGSSASEIAAVLPMRSRNAVIGIVRRQGWVRPGGKEPGGETATKAPNWKPDEIEEIKAMWIAGKPRKEIAAHYPDRTLGAVVALIYRCGLKREHAVRPEKVKKVAAPKAVKKEKPAKTVVQLAAADKSRASCADFGAKAIEAFAEPANDTSMLLWKRGRYQCAWPVGDGQGVEMMCCGRPVDPTATDTTKSYCSQHRAIASTGIKQIQKAPREANVIARRGPSRSVWDGGRVA